MRDDWPAGEGEMAQRVRAYDWSATPLGPIAAWSERMRAVVDLVLAHGFPMVAQFGAAQISIYNDAYRPILGIRHPATFGRPLDEVWPEIREANAELVARITAGETLALPNVRFTNARHGTLEDGWYDLTASPLRDERGGIAGVLVTVFETTERVLAEQARARIEEDLRAGEERQAYLLRLSDAVRPLAAPAEIQAVAMRLLGEHLGAARAQYWEVASDVAGGVRIADYGVHAREAFEAGRTLAVDDVARIPGITETEIAAYLASGVRAYIGVPLVKEGKLVAVLGVQRPTVHAWASHEIAIAEQTADRTWAAVERARAEARLRESEAELAAAFEAAPMGFSVLDATGHVLRMNQEMRRYLPTGLIPSRDAERSSRWIGWSADGAVVAPSDYPAARALRGERMVPGLEMLYQQDDGEKVWTSVSAVPLRDAADNVTGAFAIVRDIHVLKQIAEALRESEDNFRAVFETMQEGFRVLALVRDATGAIADYRTVMSNPAARRQVSLPLQEMVDAIARVVETTTSVRLELHATEEGRWFDTRIYPRGNDSVAVISEDITVRKQAEMGLASFAVERETLLKELHHRVKNNLGVIDSLLQLQADSIDNVPARVALLEASNRVHAIAEAHRLLYDTASLASVDLRAYVKALARALFDGMVLDHARVTLTVDAEPVSLDLRRAVPLGLLLNEVLTNAFRHAFPAGTGAVVISLREHAGDIELAITDDGAGFVAPPRPTALGLKLVHVLAEQLQGAVTIDASNGTAVRLRMPA